MQLFFVTGDGKMPEVLIKYFVLISCSFYTFNKLLHLKARKKCYLLNLMFVLIVLPLIYVSKLYATPLSIIVIISIFVVFSVKVNGIPVNLSVVTSVVAVGFGYLTFVVAATLSSVLLHFLFARLQSGHVYIYNSWLLMIFTTFIQSIFIVLLFRIKRLKNGMPFLIEHGSSNTGVYVCAILLAAASFLGVSKDYDFVKLVPILFILASGLIILAWWRKSLTTRYMDRIRAQEIQALRDAVAEKDAEIRRLKSHNDELSKIIHKDNKLIPALELAVRQYLKTAENEPDPAVRRAKAKSLLSQIESKAKERTGIIRVYEINSKSLPSTAVPSFDALLSYMLQRAIQFHVDFDVSLFGSVKYLVENIADEQDVNTLLADLIDNALIAAKDRAFGKVLVNIGIVDECYRIDVFDNGAPFSPETIAMLGLRRTTTRAGEGGSGIGLMSLFEIVGRYNASFVIEDICSGRYTKKVSVCFDQLGQFRVKLKQGGSMEPLTARSLAAQTNKNLQYEK